MQQETLQETLFVRYDGKNAATGEMDSCAAIGSMIAFTDLLRLAAKEGLGPNVETHTTIRGVAAGSCEIDFGLIVTGAIALFPVGTDIMKQGVLVIIQEIISLRRHLKGRAPAQVQRTQDGRVVVNNGDGNTLTITQNTFEVFLDPRSAKDLESVIATPLATEAEEINITRSNGEVVERVEAKEAAYFNVAEISTNTTEVQKTSDRMQLRIERVVFDKNIDGRFTDLASPIHSFQAAMEDTAFLDSVRAGGERFGNGDTIQATVRRTEVVKPSGSSSVQYAIEEVHDHKPGPKQSNFLEGSAS